MQIIELALVLLLVLAVGGALVRWTSIGLPIFLVVVGAAASFIPGLDHIAVDPEVFLLLFIPPLLFADARVLPRRDLLHVIEPVLLLALGLVVLTVIVVGFVIHGLVPALPLAVAFTLGAIVTPTDAVATAATTVGLPLPNRVSHTINAESLLNDATGLVAFKLAVAAAAAAGAVSGTQVLTSFLMLSGGGVAVGVVVEWLGRRLRERLIRLGADDPVLQTLLCVLIPYAAYLAAEAIHVSGVLAVVIAGLWAGGKEVKGLSIDGRRHSREVWRMIGYVFNGLVFVLLGLQLRHMLTAVAGYSPWWLAGMALVLWALLMALRFGWVWASAYLRFRYGWGWAGDNTGPDWRRLFLTSWAAVRGSVTLATALSVPLLTTAGAALPGRDLVVFLAAATIILTLALNGVTLPWFIRKLQAPSYGRSRREEEAARAELARAGIATLEPLLPLLEHPGTQAFAAQQINRYRSKIVLHEGSPEASAAKAEHIAAAREVRLKAIAAERECLYQLHATDQINEATLLAIEEELDERERLSAAEPSRG